MSTFVEKSYISMVYKVLIEVLIAVLIRKVLITF